MRFKFRLAHHLGMTVEELHSRLSASEYLYWQVLEHVEPYGERGDYLRAGIIAATIANVNRSKDTKPYSPADFMPTIKEPREPQTPEQIHNLMLMLQAAQEAHLNRERTTN